MPCPSGPYGKRPDRFLENDGLLFVATSVNAEPIREETEYGGMRVSLMAELGRAKIPLQVDIGLGDAITPKASIPAGGWVVLDEVQKVPALLDEVQRLIETGGLRFILCGSSARKLKRSGVNLLAGRAIDTRMFPLASAELGRNLDLQAAIANGTLPLAVTGTDPVGFLIT